MIDGLIICQTPECLEQAEKTGVGTFMEDPVGVSKIKFFNVNVDNYAMDLIRERLYGKK